MTANAIELRDIEKSFGPVEVLKGVSLTVAPSRCYGLVGDNGAGKSTLLKILTVCIPVMPARSSWRASRWTSTPPSMPVSPESR